MRTWGEELLWGWFLSKKIKEKSLFDYAEDKQVVQVPLNMKLDFSQSVGDPMVEIGRLGLIEFCGKENFESFEELKKEVTKLFNIYTFKTSGRIGQVFSSNSKFTHNSTGKDLNERFRQSLELYDEMTKESYSGYCLSCGQKDNLCSVSKTIFPLTTGNSNANFTSNFSNKFLMCKECMTSLFFAPINMQKTTGRMGFMISNNEDINKFWSEENIDEFNANIVKNVDSLVDSKINIFENKTLRYPGHWSQFIAYQQLGLFELEPIKIKGKDIIPRDVFHSLLEPKIMIDKSKDICVIRVVGKGRKDGELKTFTIDLFDEFDETTGFTAMQRLTGWHASIVAILAAQGKIGRGAVPEEKAIPGKMIIEEAEKRGLVFSEKWN